MERNLWEPVVTIAAAVVGVAIISVLVSKNAQTPQVLGAAGSAFANVLSAATAPVTGSAATPNVSSGTGGFGNFGLSGFGQLSLNH